jgi:hypothetical protein
MSLNRRQLATLQDLLDKHQRILVEELRRDASRSGNESYGLRTFRMTEIALYHALGKLPEAKLAHRFC